mmetsp:Transcript_19806/g.55697  ORF Transcript_19806/g.55697 Transcript_19806/m.55697 type:complete len:218 (-) Transcript_19806:283-936(-)
MVFFHGSGLNLLALRRLLHDAHLGQAFPRLQHEPLALHLLLQLGVVHCLRPRPGLRLAELAQLAEAAEDALRPQRVLLATPAGLGELLRRRHGLALDPPQRGGAALAGPPRGPPVPAAAGGAGRFPCLLGGGVSHATRGVVVRPALGHRWAAALPAVDGLHQRSGLRQLLAIIVAASAVHAVANPLTAARVRWKLHAAAAAGGVVRGCGNMPCLALR